MPELDVNFKAVVTALAKHAGSCADQVELGVPVEAFAPAGPDTPQPHLVGSLDIPFDRSQLGAEYAAALADGKSPGTVGTVIGVKRQSDYLASAERAYRLQHATQVRRLGHFAARRSGHAHSAGVFLRGVLESAAIPLKKGAE